MIDPPGDAPPLSGAPDAPPERARQHDARRVAAALDVLVRTSKTDPRNAERLAARSTEAMRGLVGALRLAPRRLLYDDAVVMTASGTEAAWCLPAYMAGLRGLSVRPELAPDELLEFAQRLGQLRVDIVELEAFRDSLWAGGFDGLVLDVAPSFVDVATTLEVVGRANTSVAAVRAFAAFSDDAVTIKVPELDSAVLEAEFDVPVEPLKRAWRTRTLDRDGDQPRAVRAVVDPRSWARCEVELPVRHESTRSFVAAKRAAKRAAVWLDGPLYDVDVARATELLESRDPYVESMVAACGAASIGRAVGAGVILDEGGAKCSLQLLASACDEAAKRALALAMVERSARDSDARALLARWTGGRERSSLANLVVAGAEDLARESKLSMETARAVKELLDSADQGAALLGRWAKAAPPELLSSDHASRLFEVLGVDGARLLTDLDMPRREAILQHAASSDAGVDAIAAAITATHGALFTGKSLFKALAALLRTPRGCTALLSLAADRKADDAARCSALDVAATRDDLAGDALGSRIKHLLDSDTVREHRAALKRARKTLGRS